MNRIVFLVFATLISMAAYSQGKAEFTLSLKDGNVVTGTSNITQITLNTDYGKLVVPVENITSIALGIHADKTQKADLEKIAKELLNSNEEIRKKAYEKIIAKSVNVIPVLESIVFSGEYEPSEFSDYTLTAALNELKAIHNVSSNYKTKDVVTIDYEYHMGGAFSFDKMLIKTEYGELTIPRNKIDKIDVIYYDGASGDGMKTYRLLASTHISSNQNGGWYKTGIMVKNGQSLNILANGEITLASLSSNKYKPDGSTKNTYSDDFTPSTSTSTSPVYGNVVYKIGENGTAQKAGDSFSGRANASGMLYLSIYETVYNASNSGFYIVKVKAK